MQRIISVFLSVLKVLLLIISFTVSIYIIMVMYYRVEKNIMGALPIFLPFILLLLLYFINFIFHQHEVNNTILYNITSCIVFSVILFVEYRTIFDKNMLLNEIMGYKMNFLYFSDFIPFMKVLIYGLIISNICLMLQNNDKAKKKLEVL